MTSADGHGNRHYVIAEMQGRIGNQLFQFASAYAIARRRAARLLFWNRIVAAEDLLLPAMIGSRYVAPTRAELLRVGQFTYAVPPRPLWQSVSFRGTRAIRRARGRTPAFVNYWDTTGRYRPEVFELDTPVVVKGHLQSERFFEEFADDVAAAITLPAAPPLPNSNGPVVAVSFRRGDYNSLGWALPIDYYDRALDHIAERVSDPTYLLLGDDLAFLDLVADRIRPRGPVLNGLDFGTDPLAQLATLAACDHCIIPNSSFAWWGAWFGDRRRRGDVDRVVIAPSEYGIPDRLPERWIGLPGGIPPT